MKIKKLLNPIGYYKTSVLAIIGSASLVIFSLIGYLMDVIFDGVFDLHIWKSLWYENLLFNIINVFSVTVSMLAFGYIINKKVRIIDLLLLGLISRLPVYLGVFIIGNKWASELGDTIIQGINEGPLMGLTSFQLLIMLIMGLILFLLLILQVIILYFGFKTSVNAKTISHTILFVISLIVAEITSKLLIHLIF